LSWQDLNKTGSIIEKLSIYGSADGIEDVRGKYLVKEKNLLSDDPFIWAVTSYKYISNGQISEVNDPEGFKTFYDYDNNGYLKKIRKGTAISNSPVQRFCNDLIGQRRLEASYLGGVTLNDYDGFGRLWRVRKYSDSTAMTRSDATFIPGTYEAMTPISTVIYGYDPQGNRTYEQKCDCGGGEIHIDYTVNGLHKKTLYNDGSFIQNSYDGRGLKIQEYRYDANTTEDWSVIYEYDDTARLVQTIWYDYDDTSVVKAQTLDYWGCGKIKSEEIYGYGLILEKQINYYYDILDGLSESIISPDALNLITSYYYDAAGNRISVTDPKENIILHDYDNANRRIKEYFATEDTEAAEIKKEMTYYKNGMVKDVNNYDYDGSLLSRSKLEYDPRGRVTRVVQDINETQQAVTAYEYSDTGFGPGNEYHIKITDAENKITWRKLSSFGKLIKVLHPSGDYEEYEYNADCTLKKKAVWDANDTKHWLEYYYDDYARLKDVDYPDGGNVHHTYDGFGRKILTADNRNSQDRIGGSNTIEYEYDVLDRLSRLTEQDNYKIEYAYQADGQKQYIKVRQPDNLLVYHTEYSYDTAGRLYMVKEPLLGTNSYIARFGYDDNGNRSELKYYRTGSLAGPTTTMSYTYDMENNLRSYNTTGSGAFSFDASQASDIDGLGRLLNADETLTKADQTAKNHSYSYGYDMHSQLINAEITNIGGSDSQSEYIYHKNGNLNYQYLNDDLFDRSYNGNLLAELETDIDFAFLAHLSGCWLSNDPACLGSDYSGDSFVNFDDFALLAQMWLEKGARQLSYDLNGNMISSIWSMFSYDWDAKLRSAGSGGSIGSYRYAPSGGRIYKETALGQRKFIVDISGGLSTILLELNAANNTVMKTYIYGKNGEILAQHGGDYTSPRYFYLNDRLGSVRMVIDSGGMVKNSYTYNPFGEMFTAESAENAENPFKFTGQWYDEEISQYYLRARQYDPQIMRFTARDLIPFDYNEPMTLHKYLYCENDAINRIDWNGLSSRSASQGIPQWSFDDYMGLWNEKMDPFEPKTELWRGGVPVCDISIRYAISGTLKDMGSRGLTALVPVNMGGAFLKAGPNMYVILYYRLLQHGMINAILREDFGIESDLYDLQDFRLRL